MYCISSNVIVQTLSRIFLKNMDKYLKALWLFILFSVLGVPARSGDTCTTSRSYSYVTYSYSYTYQYCSNDCCGSWPFEYCCVSYDSVTFTSTNSIDGDNSWIIGVIVGSIIGFILIVSCIVAVICATIKKKNRPGIVVQPGIAMTTNTSYLQQGVYHPSPVAPPPPVYQQPAETRRTTAQQHPPADVSIPSQPLAQFNPA